MDISDIKSILIVEDEPSIRKLCERILANEGFEVTLVENARIARDIIIERQFDLYLVDALTPSMNGRELYQWLREEKPEQISHLIFTSGAVLSEPFRDFLAESRVPFLPKPFTQNEILFVIRERYRQLSQ